MISVSVICALITGFWVRSGAVELSPSASSGASVSVVSELGLGVITVASSSAGAVAQPARTSVEMISVLISIDFFGILCLSFWWFT
jgi:hypothetical protein